MLTSLRHIKLILVFKGYHFSRYYCQGAKIRWQCVNRRCEAYIYSVEDKIIVTYPVHNHLSIIPQNSTSTQTKESNAAFSLEDRNTLSAADIDTVTSCYDNNVPLDSEETFNPSQSFSSLADSNLNRFGNIGTHVIAANTIIPHDPSLEITVKSKSASTETENNDVGTSITTTFTSGPDPLAVCNTSYTPPMHNDYVPGDYDRFGTGTNFNYMSVPKNVRAKVTIKTKPHVSKPRVYYDGKPARTAKKNIFTQKPKIIKSYALVANNTLAKSNTLTANDSTSTARNPSMGNPMPIISIPRSQIVSGSDPQSTLLYNILSLPAQTHAPDQRASTFSVTTPNTLGSRQDSDNPSSLENLARDFPLLIPRVSIPPMSLPRVPILTEPVDHPQRRSTRSTRGRHSKFRPQNTNE